MADTHYTMNSSLPDGFCLDMPFNELLKEAKGELHSQVLGSFLDGLNKANYISEELKISSYSKNKAKEVMSYVIGG